MQIYEALRNDHDKVKDLLAQLLALSDENAEDRHDLISQIRDELIPHARAEESVFYNSIRALDSAKDVVMHSYQEHMEAETHLRLLQLRDRIDAEWKETAQKLKSDLEHHIQEEETKIFNVARQLFTNEEAEMMGEAFESLKPEVKIEGFLGTTVDMITNMMPPRLASAFRTRTLDAKLAGTPAGSRS